MTIGERIKYFREVSGMTQQELADRIGVKFPAISKYENGTVDNLPLERVELIAKALGVTPGQITGWEEYIPEERAKVKQVTNIIKDLPDEQLDKIIKMIQLMI